MAGSPSPFNEPHSVVQLSACTVLRIRHVHWPVKSCVILRVSHGKHWQTVDQLMSFPNVFHFFAWRATDFQLEIGGVPYCPFISEMDTVWSQSAKDIISYHILSITSLCIIIKMQNLYDCHWCTVLAASCLGQRVRQTNKGTGKASKQKQQPKKNKQSQNNSKQTRTNKLIKRWKIIPWLLILSQSTSLKLAVRENHSQLRCFKNPWKSLFKHLWLQK